MPVSGQMDSFFDVFYRNIIISVNSKNVESYVHVSAIVYKYSFIQTFDLKLVSMLSTLPFFAVAFCYLKIFALHQ